VIEAAKYFKMSADQGNQDGQSRYGLFLERGTGVEQNVIEAAKYYKLSADQGDSTGQNRYGDCLEKGRGVDQNPTNNNDEIVQGSHTEPNPGNIVNKW
jgi:TPR repeat protein